MVEAGGVELRRPIDSTQVIEKARRTTRKKRRKRGSAVHDMFMTRERETQYPNFYEYES